ncbi:transcription termination/antitermination NusG family protein [Pseudomonas saliphila]|uniref:transcription termination/antitermination NusG family protein n=1 Tax=Pseudomonas saliphila TaxID=2586906 RepID=UPI001238B126|nr:transcription termination/antitermination NusG family protein [Pseudomonas saliphila]
MNNHREMPEVAWSPIQCRTRQQDRTGEHLAHQGLERFNPSSRVEKLPAGKVKRQEQPMFPGNLFAIIKTQDNWAALPATRDISRVVSGCGQKSLTSMINRAGAHFAAF